MPYVVDLEGVGNAQRALVGGKAAQLGALSRLAEARVPAGFCVTTDAFARALAGAAPLDDVLDALARVGPDDREAIGSLSLRAREAVAAVTVPDEVAAAVAAAVAALGDRGAYAVRSSATAEDGPSASFAGQHDSYLDVTGTTAVVEHVRRCWASAFTERAVTYRLRNGLEHRAVRMAVIVQRMVPARAAGVLFTADPVSSNRKLATVEATVGLGEALVAGTVTPDVLAVRDGRIVSRTIATRPGAPGPALTDAQVLRLVALGRRIEDHFGQPQDIEWCLAGDELHVVQSRPITTLFPVPAAADDLTHVYVSVGHQQMMTDAMKPLGLSVWQRTTPRPMAVAGGRLFVDVAPLLASPATRAGLLAAFHTSDPLMGDALQAIVDRGDLIPRAPAEGLGAPRGVLGADLPEIETDPAIITELIERADASVAALEDAIRARSGPALVDFVLADLEELGRVLFEPRSLQAATAGMHVASRLDELLEAWLGERGATDVLTQSVPNNVTSEMGLALLVVADAIRPHAEVVAFLERVEDEGFEDDRFLRALGEVAGGREARAALEDFLDRYGMRCVGEIDITRPRWSERPTSLVPAILGDVRHFAAGAAQRRFEEGRQRAAEQEHELLERLRALPDGERKAREVRGLIRRLRTFAGYREHPKYFLIRRYFVHKRALLAEAERLVAAGVLPECEDLFFLTLEELRDLAGGARADAALISERKDAFRASETLTPPRVITSEGEVVTGRYRRDDVPAGALPGLPVSAGTVEGRARVVHDIAQADLRPGDVLVTAFTDPSWTPLFLAVEGLVTEVGGLMTHGAVIAREYGLPAVVGVEGATRRIRDGQRIRVHGTEGYVELLG